MRILHFTTDTGETAQVPISDRIAEEMRARVGSSIADIPDSEGALQVYNAEYSLVGLLLTGVVEAVAEQAKMAAVAESTALVNEAEQILERTTNEQIATGEKLPQTPNPAGMFEFAEGKEGEIYQRGEDGLMRRVATVVEEAASSGLQRRIVRLLQADACEGGNLAAAPSVCRMAWKSLKERDERINVLNSRILEMSEAVEKVDMAAGPRPEGYDLATHVGNLRAKVDFAAKEGYLKAFYLMAEYLGIGGAKALSPSVVFDEQILPALKELIRFRQANIGQNEVGDIVRAAARALDIEMAADERALSFFREEVIPAIEVLKSHSDVSAAFDREEMKALRDSLATETMKVLLVHGIRSFDARSESIAKKSFEMADDMLKVRG